MGTISEKISYLAETKARQKTLINALGGNITNDTPFREYEKELVGVLPKVTGEGTNISLSPTIEYDLEVESYKGDTTQNTLTGKNYCFTDYLEWELGEYNFSGEKVVNPGRCRTKELVYVDSGITLYLNTFSTTSQFVIRAFDINKNYLRSYGAINSGSTLAIQNDVNYLGVILYNPNSSASTEGQAIIYTIQNGSCQPFICNNTVTNKNFEPYCGGIPSPNPNYPQDIQVVTGTQIVKVEGKNLVNFSNCTENKAWTESGTLTTNSACWAVNEKQLVTGSAITISIDFPFTAGTQGRFYQFNEGGTLVGNNAITSFPTTITFNQNAKYFTYFFVASLVPFNSKLQIEYGSSATSYSPYTSQTYTLHLGDEELYEDGFISEEGDKWYINNVYSKKIMTGNNIVQLTGEVSVGTNYRHVIQFSGATNANKAWCNWAKFLKDYGRDEVHFYLAASPQQMILFVPLNYQQLKARANEVPIETIYPLQTKIEITNTTLLADLNNIKENAMSYSGTTNISSSGNLPVIISARALKGE